MTWVEQWNTRTRFEPLNIGSRRWPSLRASLQNKIWILAGQFVGWTCWHSCHLKSCTTMLECSLSSVNSLSWSVESFFFPITGNSALNSKTTKNSLSSRREIQSTSLFGVKSPAPQVRQAPVCKVSGAFPDLLQLSQHQLPDQLRSLLVSGNWEIPTWVWT